MKEIHLSKNSYCSFRDATLDHQYDIIIFDISEIASNIQQAKINRAARLLRETSVKIDPNEILDTDLIFRIMSWEHIPMLPPKKTLAEKVDSSGASINKFFEDISSDENVTEIDNDIEDIIQTNIKADHIRINFPPFLHYRLDDKNNLLLVGKSHWKGSIIDGEFCKTHGNLTDNLARMIMKLAEKYASKGNWRNYSYREEMEGQAIMQLIQVALQFDESKSSNPFSFLTTVTTNAFLRILNIEKKNQQLRDKLLLANNMNPSFSMTNQSAIFESE